MTRSRSGNQRSCAAPLARGGITGHAKSRIGCETPLNRHFCGYEPPRLLEVIEADLKTLEAEIGQLLAEVTA
ncbi:hypothetical protein [Candidatus Poriferisodalis sp.]|uniref:hypothetical protein n=1 Tax=Candidatus Poriferisodalis sp. TaxID=3101277 RepID=UPI003B01CC2A